MRFPTVPDLDNLSDYLNWQCIHILSSRKYHDFVTEQASQSDQVQSCELYGFIRFAL